MRVHSAAGLGFLALVVGFTSASAKAGLVITEVMSSSGSGGTPDWFEVTNTGSASVDLTGYQMDDNSYAYATSVPMAGVPSLASGATAVFLEGGPTDVTNFRTFWGGGVATAAIGYYSGSGVSLGSGGDGVVLFDSTHAEVVGTHISIGAATTGSSFTNDGSNNFAVTQSTGPGVFSSVGTPTNIGSPGVAITPEPTALALVGLGTMIVRRRR